MAGKSADKRSAIKALPPRQHEPAPQSVWYPSWMVDASYKLGSKSLAELNLLEIVRTQDAAAFLRDPVSPFQLIAGAKGSGKTMVLALKAAALSQHHGKKLKPLMPRQPYINSMSKALLGFPPPSVGRVEEHATWFRLWLVALGAAMCFVALRRFRAEAGKHLGINHRSDGQFINWLMKHRFAQAPREGSGNRAAEAFLRWAAGRVYAEPASCIYDLVFKLVEQGMTAVQCEQWYVHWIKPALLDYDKTGSLYVAFVDSLDELLPSLDESQARWTGLQTGFAAAVCQLRDDSAHRVLVFGCIRHEVLQDFSNDSLAGPTKMKARVVHLAYNSRELEAIYRLNVDHDTALVDRTATDPSQRLFGVASVPNRLVWDETESVFQRILRHTFHHPRDVVHIAGEAKKKVDASEQVPGTPEHRETLIDAINEASLLCLDDWKKAVIPRWPLWLDAALTHIHRNVLTREQVVQVEQRFQAALGAQGLRESGPPSLFSALYARGLVGLPTWSQDERCRLTFRPPDGHELPLPDSAPYIALHPALASDIMARANTAESRPADFYSNEFVVGDALPAPQHLEHQRVEVRLDRRTGYRLTVDGKLLQPLKGDAFLGRAAPLVTVALLLAMRRSQRAMVPVEAIQKEVVGLLKELDRCEPLRRISEELRSAINGESGPKALNRLMDGLKVSKSAYHSRLYKELMHRYLDGHGLTFCFEGGATPQYGFTWLADSASGSPAASLTHSQISVVPSRA